MTAIMEVPHSKVITPAMDTAGECPITKPFKTDTVLVSCMDGRLCFKQRHAVRQKYGIMEADLISHGGGAYRLCDPRIFASAGTKCTRERLRLTAATRVSAQFDIRRVGIEKHGATRLVLCGHHCCGFAEYDGYKFSKDRFEEEKSFHHIALQNAAEWVNKACPGLKEVVLCFVYFEVVGGRRHVNVEELPFMK